MNRFSKDNDLAVKANKEKSNNSNRNRFKDSALGYKIDGLELINEYTVDKNGSVTALYIYDSLFNLNDLFKFGKIQVELTSFIVSEPVDTYIIKSFVYIYLNIR